MNYRDFLQKVIYVMINPLIKDIFASRKGNVMSSLETFAPKVQKQIDKLIENIEGNE